MVEAPPNRSTVEVGNEFRELVGRMLAAAGFHKVVSEHRDDFKKTDISAERHEIDGLLRFRFEAKHYAGALPKSECINFVAEYGTLIDDRKIDRAWLISAGPISPDGRALIDANNRRGLRCFTFEEFQRTLLGLDGYLQDLIGNYDRSSIKDYYISPSTTKNESLEEIVLSWMVSDTVPPLAVIGSYGQGKSTFALHLAASLAKAALADPAKRVPILVPLGNIASDQSLDGLIGKVLASQHRVHNYHFHLFKALNDAGRFLIIYDGLDEMKHGMGFAAFERNMKRLLELDATEARLLFLGRDTAFHNQDEFKSIIHGVQRTGARREVQTRGRRALEHVQIRGFNTQESTDFISRYFPISARAYLSSISHKLPNIEDYIAKRTSLLTDGRFGDLLERPVHAQMLCEVAADPDVNLAHLTHFDLYDTFIHFLIEREVNKPGRDPAFSRVHRRSFNAAIAWWLWARGQSTATSLDAVPIQLCHTSVEGVDHDLDEEELRRELVAGCLVFKESDVVYFGHRSIQEFLVAEHLYTTNLDGRGSLPVVWSKMTTVVADFIVERLMQDSARHQIVENWLLYLDGWRPVEVNLEGAELFWRLLRLMDPAARQELEKRVPIHVFLEFFSENGAARFDQTNPKSIGLARRFLTAQNRPIEWHAAANLLWMRLAVAQKDIDAIIGMAGEFIVNCLSLAPLARAMDAADKNRHETHYVDRSKDFGLWLLLRSCKVLRTDKEGIVVEVHVDELLHQCRLLTGIDFEGTNYREMRVSVPANEIIDPSAKGPHAHAIRNFLTKEQYRKNIKPIVIGVSLRKDPVTLRDRVSKSGS